ncbi:MAG: DUF4249 domain-containing protein [Bacteroidales bacterium]|nr:DUF4249 domain-containing protein [Bacteroidales bacterium]
MKTTLFGSLFYAGICVALTGCYQDIDLDRYKGQNGEHLLTLNSIINPDSTIAVAATRTYFFSDVHNERDYIKDLDITVLINGEDRGKLSFDLKTNLYSSHIKPNVNDEVELHTAYSNSIITCSDIIPPIVRIESVEVERKGPLSVYTDRDYIFTYRITFTDPVGMDNYYFLHYDTSDFHIGVSMGERDYTYEYVFQQLANRVNSNIPGWEPYSPYGLPFTDYGIEGKTHTLIVREFVQGGNGRDLTKYSTMNRKFKLFSISKDYYQYLLSVLYNDTESEGLHGGMIDLGISEPIKYFTNIKGGVGIFAAYSLDETDVDVMSIVGRFPK